MSESPDSIHGRLKEGAHIAGYSLERALENFRWLLENERWRELGFEQPNDFLHSVEGAFSQFRLLADQRKDIVKLIDEQMNDAANTSIAGALGVDEGTVRRDRKGSENSDEQTKPPPAKSENSEPSTSHTEGTKAAQVAMQDAEPEFDYKRDTKSNAPRGLDAMQTPGYAIDPLLPYLGIFKTIWEPAAGEGLLVEAFYDSGFDVIASDIITAQDFFEYEPDESWDCIVTNPPFSKKYPWLERCYDLGRPFALLLPIETLGAGRAQRLFEKHGIEIILLDKRVNFKMPNKGWEGGGAQFPTAWFTWGLGLGLPLVFGKLTP